MKRAAFLFGSGISLPSGAPGVCEITDAILNRGWRNDGNDNDPRFSQNGTESSGEAKRAQEFLRILKNYIDPHLRRRENRGSHYEDIYAAAVQILQDEMCEIVNPMLCGSVCDIKNLAAALYQGRNKDDLPRPFTDQFTFLVYIAHLLISWGVLDVLWPIETPKGLETLTSCAKGTDQMDIFSLNHDMLIEQQLKQNEIPFSDGFSDKRGDVLRFNWSWKNEKRVRLYKLHGSLDWYPFAFPENEHQSKRDFAKVSREVKPDKCKDSKGTNLELLNPLPLFLAGTVTKDRLYGIGFLRELFCQFHASLNEHQTLICCGYGWKDKGINNAVTQWLGTSNENRIVILQNNGSPDKLKQSQYWSTHWNRQGHKVVVFPKWFSECTLNDLQPFFDK
jgi:hypothetical protein